jgi:hypothetical protein
VDDFEETGDQFDTDEGKEGQKWSGAGRWQYGY